MRGVFASDAMLTGQDCGEFRMGDVSEEIT